MMMTPSSRLSMPSKSTERSTEKCKNFEFWVYGNRGFLGDPKDVWMLMIFTILGSNTRSWPSVTNLPPLRLTMPFPNSSLRTVWLMPFSWRVSWSPRRKKEKNKILNPEFFFYILLKKHRIRFTKIKRKHQRESPLQSRILPSTEKLKPLGKLKLLFHPDPDESQFFGKVVLLPQRIESLNNQTLAYTI